MEVVIVGDVMKSV